MSCIGEDMTVPPVSSTPIGVNWEDHLKCKTGSPYISSATWTFLPVLSSTAGDITLLSASLAESDTSGTGNNVVANADIDTSGLTEGAEYNAICSITQTDGRGDAVKFKIVIGYQTGTIKSC